MTPPTVIVTVTHVPNPAKRERLAALVDRLTQPKPAPEQARERQTAQQTA